MIKKAAEELKDNIKAIVKYKNSDSITCDLSGGKDSRTLLSVCLNNNDLIPKLRIRSNPKQLEDANVAISINSFFNLDFESNNRQHFKQVSFRQGLNIYRSFKTGLYYHLPPTISGNFCAFGDTKNTCRITGACGEYYRNYIWDIFPSDPDINFKDFILNKLSNNSDLKFYSSEQKDSTINYILSSLKQFNNYNFFEARQKYYEWSRARKHFGLIQYDLFASEFCFTPLLSINAWYATKKLCYEDKLNARVQYDLINLLKKELNYFPYYSDWKYASDNSICKISINPQFIIKNKEKLIEANLKKLEKCKANTILKKNFIYENENESLIFLCAEASYRIFKKFPKLLTNLFVLNTILYKYYFENTKKFRITATKILSIEDALLPLNTDRELYPLEKINMFINPIRDIISSQNGDNTSTIIIILKNNFKHENYSFSLYICENGKIMEKLQYQESNIFTLDLSEYNSPYFAGFAKLKSYEYVYFLDSRNSCK